MLVQKQGLKQCPDCRSRDLRPDAPNESSPNLKLTDLVTKQGCRSTTTWWLRPRLLPLSGGLVDTTTATATTTTAAAQWRLGGYDHGNGYDHACRGSTTAAITTMAMVTITGAMVTIAVRNALCIDPAHPRTGWNRTETGTSGTRTGTSMNRTFLPPKH